MKSLFARYSNGEYMDEESFFKLLQNENLSDLSWSNAESACKVVFEGTTVKKNEFCDILCGVGDVLDATVIETVEQITDSQRTGTFDLTKLKSRIEK